MNKFDIGFGPFSLTIVMDDVTKVLQDEGAMVCSVCG